MNSAPVTVPVEVVDYDEEFDEQSIESLAGSSQRVAIPIQ